MAIPTSLGPDEEVGWHAALAAAMPDETIVAGGDHADIRRGVEIAIVANPRPGSLRELPHLR